MDNIVKTTVLLDSIAGLEAMNEVYVTFFISACPVRATPEVAAFPKAALVEIGAVVHCGK